MTDSHGVPPSEHGLMERLWSVVRAADSVVETGQRIRSDPAGHELSLASLCNAMRHLAEISSERTGKGAGRK